MNIVIVGFGKVGSKIYKVCLENNINVKAIVSPNNKFATHKSLSDVHIDKDDVVIDFSKSDLVQKNVEIISKFGASIVMGTTGWDEEKDNVKKIVSEYGIGFAYTPNYISDVHIFWGMINFLVSRFESGNRKFHAHLFEKRLITKKSSSVTARNTAKFLEQKEKICFETKNNFLYSLSGHKAMDVLLELNSNVSNFSIHFELPDEEKNNEIYAHMAVKAAKWIQGKKGFFELDSKMIQEIEKTLVTFCGL